MGGLLDKCFGSDDDEAKAGLTGTPKKPQTRKDIDILDMQTPCVTDIVIPKFSDVTMRLTALDKERTVEVDFLNAQEKAEFDAAYNKILGRYRPHNKLSVDKWRTKDELVLADQLAPGKYYLVCRSSSKLSDKNVMIKCILTKEYIPSS
eukprot:NODE_5101_length_733_cov_7.589181_g4284_i0.p1 GENE.NODE_5101_length_733_cov_7.589181_g4284_i0~~NODE_5101_length_733_cov_7.589181_g4284_i0.p1  ORF type:complete len:149 (+),score=28.44 NODE_5101_length_733_cov_7.589181_g4284_i0:260-706(+)